MCGAQETTEVATTVVPAATEGGGTASDVASAADSDAAKLAKRVERFGRIAPVTEQEAAEKMAKRRAKFGLPEQVIHD